MLKDLEVSDPADLKSMGQQNSPTTEAMKNSISRIGD
jgi:hypothetical protein